ncbi:hypothetical protein [Pseudoalteromonas ostreae]|uniref:hypothetical protein n=1 Tax=Pseudoalteromonas ostreae TaxID=2774154 RepID=UPI001B36D8ED|nr:hypothetical protein [Pseudoalteromonas ostreae]
METLELFTLALIFIIVVGSFLILLPMFFFIKSKKLPIAERILDDGKSIYLINGFTAGMGILHYATVFFWGWHAKRYDLYEKREQVPKDIQWWLIAYYILFMLMSFLLILFCLVMHFGFDKT